MTDIAELRTRRALVAGRQSFVYYAASKNGRAIKIGVSLTPWSRFQRLHATPLAVEPGGHPLEKFRHAQFEADRIVGEWFLVSDELTAHMANLRAEFGNELAAVANTAGPAEVERVREWYAERDEAAL